MLANSQRNVRLVPGTKIQNAVKLRLTERYNQTEGNAVFVRALPGLIALQFASGYLYLLHPMALAEADLMYWEGPLSLEGCYDERWTSPPLQGAEWIFCTGTQRVTVIDALKPRQSQKALLPEPSSGKKICGCPAIIGQRFFFAMKEQNSRNVSLHAMNVKSANHLVRVDDGFCGFLSTPVQFADNKVFFHDAQTMFLYSVANGEFRKIADQPNPRGRDGQSIFDSESRPVNFGKLVVLSGRHEGGRALFTVNDQLNWNPFRNTESGSVSYTVRTDPGSDTQSVILGTDNSVKIMQYGGFTPRSFNDFEWASQFAPVAWGNQLLVVSKRLWPDPNFTLTAIDATTGAPFFTKTYEEILDQPLLLLNRLFVVNRRGNEVELEILRLEARDQP